MARPLRLPMLWILPILVTAVVVAALFAAPPHGLGWVALLAGLVGGGMLGLWRARLMRLHIEGEEGAARVMLRQSPAALLLIAAIFVVRRIVFPQFHTGAADHATLLATMLTDFGLGLVPGLICGQRLALWLRARDMIANHRHDG
ncbi:DUF1453 family protein [Novosphingobium sp. 1949]|uniref:DUF1453 family protein n=1 Tax=Novosphingobium organovorum TaxID=2930092 RepID=A0ABT0B8M4_9SPHN|nr:CcdC protein domain-containing protein [Novosphingobium organovorum]MCJ2181201.1 DUF1453 family protein [Novosphingobium organovorum]